MRYTLLRVLVFWLKFPGPFLDSVKYMYVGSATGCIHVLLNNATEYRVWQSQTETKYYSIAYFKHIKSKVRETSRVETFANFKVMWLLAKVFSAKLGAWCLLVVPASNL